MVYRDVDYDYVNQRIGHVMDPEEYYQFRNHIYADFTYMHTDDLGCIEFLGKYPDNLFEEINNYSIVANCDCPKRPMILSTHTIGSLTQLVYMPSRCRANLGGACTCH